MIHLDTNFLIQISVTGSAAHAQFAAWSSIPETFNVSTIAWAEFLCFTSSPKNMATFCCTHGFDLR
jgi:hypothetical protein